MACVAIVAGPGVVNRCGGDFPPVPLSGSKIAQGNRSRPYKERGLLAGLFNALGERPVYRSRGTQINT